MREPLLQVFPPALLGRLDVIPYYPLSDDALGLIIRLQLDRVAKRVEQEHGIPFTFGDDVVSLIAERCTEVESGGRMVGAILNRSVLPMVGDRLLQCAVDGVSPGAVELLVDGQSFACRVD